MLSYYLYHFHLITRPYSTMIASLATITGIVLFFVNLYLVKRVTRVERHLPNEPVDNAGELEDVIHQLRDGIAALSRKLSDLEEFRTQRERQCPGCIQGIGIVRFNAFHDVGGEQSFSLALVDGNGDGVVITALHGREESCVYAKPLQSGSSSYPLSDEERAAVVRAVRKDWTDH